MSSFFCRWVLAKFLLFKLLDRWGSSPPKQTLNRAIPAALCQSAAPQVVSGMLGSDLYDMPESWPWPVAFETPGTLKLPTLPPQSLLYLWLYIKPSLRRLSLCFCLTFSTWLLDRWKRVGMSELCSDVCRRCSHMQHVNVHVEIPRRSIPLGQRLGPHANMGNHPTTLGGPM